VVEHDLAKVGVEGSNPFARSRFFNLAKLDEGPLQSGLFVFVELKNDFASASPRRVARASHPLRM
jgi:hypothetical protein